MKQIKAIAMLAIVALIAFSCKPAVEPDALTMGQATIEVPADGGSQTITFTTNSAWTIGADKNFVTFDQTSGEAGTVNVKVSFEANDGYDAREAKIEVIAGADGALTTTFLVNQAAKELVGMEMVYNLTYKPQTFEFTVNSTKSVNVEIVEGKDWISQVESKAAPVSEKLVFAVSDNTDQPKRTGKIAVTIGEDVYALIVNQGNNYVYADACTVKYIGNADRVYDNDNWTYTALKQYCITLSNSDAQAVIVFSAEPEGNPLEAIPAGVYSTDEAGTRDAGTCHVKVNEIEEFYTCVIEDGVEKVVVEAEAEIAKTGDKYEISLVAKDASGSTYRYKYEGAVAEIAADLVHADAALSEATASGQYYTYFTTKARKYYATVYLSGDCTNCAPYYSYLSFTFYGPETGSDNELPTGTFTFADKGTDESITYANGNSLYAAGDMEYVNISRCLVNSETGELEYQSSATATDATVTVAKDEDGKYTFAVKGKFTFGLGYDEDWNTIESDPVDVDFSTNGSVAIDVDSSNMAPICLDVDSELHTTAMGYVGFWYGTDKITTGSNLFYIGWNTAFDNTFKVQLTLNSSSSYTWEKNFANRYCNTPIPAGTYNFSFDKDADCLLNIVADTRKCKITNTYTGTEFYVRGGSVTFTNSSVTFNLQACPRDANNVYGDPVNFTGTVPTTCYYIQDYSAKAAPVWNEAEASSAAVTRADLWPCEDSL